MRKSIRKDAHIFKEPIKSKKDHSASINTMGCVVEAEWNARTLSSSDFYLSNITTAPGHT